MNASFPDLAEQWHLFLLALTVISAPSDGARALPQLTREQKLRVSAEGPVSLLWWQIQALAQGFPILGQSLWSGGTPQEAGAVSGVPKVLCRCLQSLQRTHTPLQLRNHLARRTLPLQFPAQR